MKFKPGDIVKCKGEHFAEREILPNRSNDVHRYKTKFLEDGDIIYDDVAIIDNNYSLKVEKEPLKKYKVVQEKRI